MKHPVAVLAILFCVLLVACGPSVEYRAPVTWIDAPLNGSIYTSSVFPLVIHSASTDGISQIEITGLQLRDGEWTNQRHFSVLPPGSEHTQPPFDSFEFAWESEGLAVIVSDQVSDPPNDIDLDLGTWDGPTKWQLWVRAANEAGAWGEYAFVEITICPDGFGGSIVIGGSCHPSATEPTLTPESAVELPMLVAIPSRNANCRDGASASLFEIDDTLIAGSEYLPIAQGPDGLWLLFEGPVTGNRCWALADNLDIFCNDKVVQLDSLLPCMLAVSAYPPLPTLTPTPTFTPEPAATSAPLPQCNDGIDNDGDGNIDMADGRCLSPTDDDENS